MDSAKAEDSQAVVYDAEPLDPHNVGVCPRCGTRYVNAGVHIYCDCGMLGLLTLCDGYDWVDMGGPK